MRILGINGKFWGGGHSIIPDTVWSEVDHLRHFEINPAGSFISWCKKPQIVNHLQMLRILELSAQPGSAQSSSNISPP